MRLEITPIIILFTYYKSYSKVSTLFTSVFVFIIFVYYLQELHSKFTIGSLQKPLLKFRSINPFNLISYFAMIYSYPFGFQCFSGLLKTSIHWNHPIYQNQWWFPRTESRPVVKAQRHLVTKTSHQEKKDIVIDTLAERSFGTEDKSTSWYLTIYSI